MLVIVPFETKYTQNFKDLNIAWITEYFEVEDKDRELLDDSQAAIIDKGGHIFIGLWHNEPVGCFALIKKNEKRFELGKMAVSKSHRGLRIGQQLLSYAINFAKNKNYEVLELYSSTKLDTALHIYRKHGFTIKPMVDYIDYLRSDIKMELKLK
ncbi:GNAT family N-acetyltransferase [Maribacter litoralis]|uniref:Ribosomal protein S18 acetylase RimI n=1 Tax=Maribacter litoralis TaxID=2059726 RepID=A0A653VH49_9FLAO|nr:GNAT family N-acetyltransferase [Maribacter litoralis]VXC05522.1 Ribosomal protein S18 acetylase RimI [Maribacter litoralis]